MGFESLEAIGKVQWTHFYFDVVCTTTFEFYKDLHLICQGSGTTVGDVVRRCDHWVSIAFRVISTRSTCHFVLPNYPPSPHESRTPPAARQVLPLTRTPELLLHSDHGGIFCKIFSLPYPRRNSPKITELRPFVRGQWVIGYLASPFSSQRPREPSSSHIRSKHIYFAP